MAAVCLSLAVLAPTACGGDDQTPGPTTDSQDPQASPPATETVAAPTAASQETEVASPAHTEAPTDVPTPAATEAPSPMPEVQKGPRKTGEYENINFVVSEGSEATFTVEEKLARLPLPNDAVMRTSALSGEVRLDGRPSEVRIDLHQLSSDQSYRDRYVRNRMFPGTPVATFVVDNTGPAPQGLAEGQEVTTQVAGSLQIRDITVPLVFDVEARDDGEIMYIVGRTTFTWDQMDIPTPTAAVVVSIEDEVRVEVLLALVPEQT